MKAKHSADETVVLPLQQSVLERMTREEMIDLIRSLAADLLEARMCVTQKDNWIQGILPAIEQSILTLQSFLTMTAAIRREIEPWIEFTHESPVTKSLALRIRSLLPSPA